MPKPRRRFEEPPRVLSSAEVAGYIGKSRTWFAEHLLELEAMGFPKPLPRLGGYDRAAVDEWIDHLGGRAASSPPVRTSEAWVRAAGG